MSGGGALYHRESSPVRRPARQRRQKQKVELIDMAKTSPTEFVHQVRQELGRVTWPTRKETLVTTGMVFLMVFVAAAFFFAVDQVLSYRRAADLRARAC